MNDKPWERIKVSDGHLEYYRQHSISPVSQDLSNLPVHLERRRSLYACAGLLPMFFNGLDILEVAPGSGHNSLYIASCLPENYHLCEPNPAALSGINALYDNFTIPHTRPLIHPLMLEDFSPDKPYDVVICEGWLGSGAHELKMLQKLAGFIKPGGVLVITTISPIGIIANLLRKMLAQRLIIGIEGLGAQTEILLEAFGPHLATLKDMSRPKEDWIVDNLLNPAYYGICLTPQLVFENIGDDFSCYGTSPRITTDWRWHKSLFGDQKRFNAHFLDNYYQCAHSFIDHTTILPPRPPEQNLKLEGLCWSLLEQACTWEQAGCGEIAGLVSIIENICADAHKFSTPTGSALEEFLGIFSKPAPTVQDVAAMQEFSHLFGRENLYLSLCCDGRQS